MKNKKGAVEGLPWILVRIILSVLVFLFAMWVGFQLMGIFGPGGDEEVAAKQNLDLLDENIQKLLQAPANYGTIDLEYFIPEGYFLVGYDRGEYIPRTDCKTEESTILYEIRPREGQGYPQYHCNKIPEKCTSLPCLCLYKKWPKSDEEPIDCKLDYPGGLRFAGDIGWTQISRGSLEDFFSLDFDGDYGIQPIEKKDIPVPYSNGFDDHLVIVGNQEQTIYSLQIEKTPRQGEITVTLIDYEATERNQKMKEIYTSCGQGSHELCINKAYDSIVEEAGCTNYNTCAYDFVEETCVIECLEECTFRITEKCICEGIVYDKGYCGTTESDTNKKHYDYVIPTSTGTETGHCTEETNCESYQTKETCENDPCKLNCRTTEEACKPWYEA